MVSLNAFAEAEKIMNHTGLSDTEFTCNSPDLPQWLLVHSFSIHGFRITCLLRLLQTDKFIEPSGYCTKINCLYLPHNKCWGCPCGIMVKVMDCGIVVSEFEFQLRYYVHFQANTLGKGMNPLILLAMG